MSVKIDLYNCLASKIRMLFGRGLRKKSKAINKVYQLINSFVVPEYIDNINGCRMYLDPVDSLRLSVNKSYELPETELIKGIVSPGNRVVDLGANIGYYSLLMAGLAGRSGQVIAVEPEPKTFEILRKNINANKLANISAYQLAVSDREGTVQLTLDPFNNSDHRTIMQAGECPVRTTRLDDLVGPDYCVDFIKIDIQGAEGYALDGMENIIEQSPGIQILTEYWPAGLDLSGYGAANYLRNLKGLGFVFYDVLTRRQMPQAQLLEMISVDPQGYINILCAKTPALPQAT